MLNAQLISWGLPKFHREVTRKQIPTAILAKIPGEIITLATQQGRLPRNLGLVGAPDLDRVLAFLVATSLRRFLVLHPLDDTFQPDVRAGWVDWPVLAAEIAITPYGGSSTALQAKMQRAEERPLLFLVGVGEGPEKGEDQLKALLRCRRDAGLRTLWTSPLSAAVIAARYTTPTPVIEF